MKDCYNCGKNELNYLESEIDGPDRHYCSKKCLNEAHWKADKKGTPIVAGEPRKMTNPK